MLKRCRWCTEDSEYVAYHDSEWGVETHGDNLLFEYLSLEGAQAGLSWLTILKRRDGYRKSFYDFDVAMVAKLNSAEIDEILQNGNVVRNRLKVNSVVKNAQAILEIQKEFGSFDNLIWSYSANLTKLNSQEVAGDMSKDLKKRGFSFVGPTICYAFMQAIGMVDDHEEGCFKFSARKR